MNRPTDRQTDRWLRPYEEISFNITAQQANDIST